MDYFAHGFWSYIIFHWIRRPLLAVAFGLFPDTFSWGIYLTYRLLNKAPVGKPLLEQIPAWVFSLYNVTHSIFVSFVVLLLIWAIVRRFPYYVLAWPIAIVMDLFTHKREFLPTPFLWPFSDWRFPGISWGERWFILLNYSLIALSIIAIYIYKKQKSRNL